MYSTSWPQKSLEERDEILSEDTLEKQVKFGEALVKTFASETDLVRVTSPLVSSSEEEDVFVWRANDEEPPDAKRRKIRGFIKDGARHHIGPLIPSSTLFFKNLFFCSNKGETKS